MNKTMLKDMGGIVAGFLVVLVLSVGADMVVETLGILPPANRPELYSPLHLVIPLVYRSAFTIIGGYVTAWLSTSKPMRNVIILAVVGTVFGALGTFANWDKAEASGVWYPIALLLASPLCVWLGGWLKTNK